LPSQRFNREIGLYANLPFDPWGALLTADAMKLRRDDWLPTPADEAYVKSLMYPVYEPGKMANWIAAPKRGINGKPLDFEYVRFED
jgi:benzoyl-CoA 2,3-dioxygenase component B